MNMLHEDNAILWQLENECQQLTRKRKAPVEWTSALCRTASWYDNVLPHARSAIWITNFRMPENLINKLCDIVRPDMEPSGASVRAPIPLKKRVCVAVYKLASCSEYRAVATVFGVGITSVHRCLYEFCEAMARRKHEYILWYSNEDAARLADITRGNYKYPQAFGAIDGSHIAITPPADGMADFLCRKQYPSVVLQAVADVQYLFRDTYCNTPGSAHDAAVYRRSPLSTMIHRKMPKRDIEIDGNIIPLHLLGDPAYPMSDYIIKG